MRSKAVLVAAVLGGALVSGGWLMQMGFNARRPHVYERARLFDQVIEHVARNYVEPLPESDLYGRATRGVLRTELQLFIVAVLAAYFLWCWLRGGQTLAMRAWHIRLVEVTPRKALLRFLLAAALLPLSILWALFDRDRQFLHDRLAGTRLVKL